MGRPKGDSPWIHILALAVHVSNDRHAIIEHELCIRRLERILLQGDGVSKNPLTSMGGRYTGRLSRGGVGIRQDATLL